MIGFVFQYFVEGNLPAFSSLVLPNEYKSVGKDQLIIHNFGSLIITAITLSQRCLYHHHVYTTDQCSMFNPLAKLNDRRDTSYYKLKLSFDNEAL